MPGGGGALATVHSGQSQAATGQHDGSALLQPGLTCTGRTETLLSSGARRRIWANFDRRHSSPRARSDKMLTVRKLRLVERKRLPCEPAAGRLGVDCRDDFYGFLCHSSVHATMTEKPIKVVAAVHAEPACCRLARQPLPLDQPQLPYSQHFVAACSWRAVAAVEVGPDSATSAGR